ncbi:cyclin-dependent kinase inhibitor 3 family protein [Propionivibrio limicola]|uniref:cyclin-dependent kinase inhibitor 3 family protein n=1 Tax=Propionivibrio limicola TaxID=167645 RepID=UPI0014788796|nr:cyclin-dependent kinase inhibitor 3 family protein [Propionivibrio limicola]
MTHFSSSARTSDSAPLRIDTLHLPNGWGNIGMSFCPGKKQSDALTGAWDRDLDKDLVRIRDWGASMVVSLIEEHEFSHLQVTALPERVKAHQMNWRHLPIPDRQPPGAAFHDLWPTLGREMIDLLSQGEHLFIHCMGGLGRTGTLAGCLLIEAGFAPEAAINAVRTARRNTIETLEQEDYVRNYRAWF